MFIEEKDWEQFLESAEVVNEKGLSLLTFLLERLPLVHEGHWGKAFIPLMSRVVPACIELVIIRDHKVLLLKRDDIYFKGWHTPGTYLGPRETLEDAAQRCAGKELKVTLRFIKQIAAYSNIENKRFHDYSNLLLCEIIEGEPQAGEWFNMCPADMIPEHKKFWGAISAVL